jgi:prepilin-type N-terminal cleavage/methylation domain-containing protein
MPYKKRNHFHAFTLIELTLVLAIMCFIAYLGSAHMGFLSRMMVVSDLHYLHLMAERARSMAIASGKEQKIIIDEHTRTCTFDKQVHKLANQVCFGVMPGIKGPPSKPINPLEKPISFDHNQIIFYPDGIISSGTIYLTEMKKNYQYALSCGVSEISCLRMYVYKGGKWLLQ